VIAEVSWVYHRGARESGFLVLKSWFVSLSLSIDAQGLAASLTGLPRATQGRYSDIVHQTVWALLDASATAMWARLRTSLALLVVSDIIEPLAMAILGGYGRTTQVIWPIYACHCTSDY
jgi:hypothetical protein